jgi:DNA-binding LacI/PurR family transcriptional regulator
MNRVTIKDVALRSGTSIRTVSRVINDDPKVKHQTRLRVQSVVDDMGFKVNLLARSLKVKKTRQIVVFIDQRHGMYWGLYHNEFLLELHRAIKAKGYRMVISPSSPDSFEEDDNDGFYLVKHGMCDGVIMFDPNVGDKRIPYLTNLSIPFVMIGQNAGGGDISFVDMNNFDAGYLGARALHSHGYDNLALMLGSEGSVINQERARGFTAYCLGESTPHQCLYGLSDLESVYRRALHEIREEKVKGFFVSGDERAVAVYRAVYECGLRVGEDIGILGIDNIRMGEYLSPPLHTIAPPKNEMAIAAVGMLLEQMNSDEPAAGRSLLAPSLIARSSLSYTHERKSHR